MNNGVVSRGAEKTLGIIGIIFNLLTIALLAIGILSFDNVQNTAEFQDFEQEVLNDSTFASPEDAQLFLDTFISSFSIIGWVLVAVLAISTVLAILAIANLRNNRNPKAAGVLFIIAGLFAGLLSLTSILFYIAAIMCFVRKGTRRDDYQAPRDDFGSRNGDAKLKEEQRIREEERIRQEERLREEEQRRQNDNLLHKDDDTYRPL
ncbi:hypothetical protein BN1080_03028 [Planococcus massiliensis]|uniref:DUF4064 domain-containing protein n=1 Tax=Planococcus massiliensis TaxID=1499687 RepID=A0A098EQF6_9BACL|nr:DUF4064 domain-containing protein [Planococcus massiliensis]CEG24010.1 hypothetical protein BN1080_03028 [Planococcus massiliensis]